MLFGVRVLDLGTMITGPLAALVLADLGAEVVKVEPPEGDPFRSFAPDGYGPHFVAYNRGKRSVALDLRTAEGQAALAALLGTADVLVENYRPGTLARLGFPDERLPREFPRLIHLRITGFGGDGPLADRPAYDGVAMAWSGVASLFLDPERPRASGPTVADNVTGYTGAIAVLGALMERTWTGRGRLVEVNMLEATAAFAPDAFATAAMTGETPGPLSRVASSGTHTLRCADGGLLTIHLSAPEKFWRGLCRVVGEPDLNGDPRFADRASRTRNHVALGEALAERFATRPREAWMEALREADVPHAPVLDVSEAVQGAQMAHLGLFATRVHPAKGAIGGLCAPWRVDGVRPGAGAPAPVLGEHTDEVLAELGARA